MSARDSAPLRILIPLANPRTAADLVRIGAALLRHGGSMTALSIVEVPEGMPLSEGATRARQARRLLQRVLEFTPEGVALRTMVRIGRRAAEGIVEAAAEEGADLVIFGWGGRSSGAAVFSPTIDEVVRDGSCDIAVVKQRGIGHVERVLVPVRGGPHAELALRFAGALGRTFAAEVAVLHVVPPGLGADDRARTERALASFVQRHARTATPRLVEAPSVAQAIVREAETAQLLVMGATGSIGGVTPSGAAGGGLFGALPEAVA